MLTGPALLALRSLMAHFLIPQRCLSAVACWHVVNLRFGARMGLCEPTCLLRPCQHGQCSSGVCICPFGSKGKYCEVEGAPLCGKDIVCRNNGTCVPGASPQDTAWCDCSGTFFGGTFCQAETVTCANNPCRRGGLCVDAGVTPSTTAIVPTQDMLGLDARSIH